MELLKMDIEELVTIINKALEDDKELSVNKWCDKVGIKQSTLKSKLSRGKYIYNTESRSYNKKDVTSNITNKKLVKEPNRVDNKNIILMDKINIDKFNLLLDNLDDILKLIEKKDITRNITIDSNETTVKTLRINKELYEKVRKFAKDKDITIGSILNKALIDYLNKF
ncbi:hypothetical protein [Clostridium perfringens]|uniref:hypothetical protein n=1 Tax=Clostridium perfringens TaxID=1502 RepID=UPI001A1DC3D8|nr:hypothetical protein [Clostridium perfringens]HAT4108520.1 hypothetical protein [Clostridium perfringens]